MIKLILLVTLCFSPLASFSKQTHQDENTFNILCLNTWMIPFLRKKANIRSRLIGKYSRDYDFVMLQEVFNRRQRKLITKEINKGGRFENRYQLAPYFRINSGLFNLTKYKITKSSFKRFTKCGDFQCLSGKGVLHTRVRVPSGMEIDIYNTHLQPFYDGKEIRRHQIGEILAHINKTNDGKRAVILTGDFNVSDKRSEYISVTEQLENFGLFDSWTTLNYDKPGYTWDSNINTWSARTDGENKTQHRFDYIYVKNGSRDQIELLEAKIAFNEALSMKPGKKKYFVSDHFGINVNFRLTQN